MNRTLEDIQITQLQHSALLQGLLRSSLNTSTSQGLEDAMQQVIRYYHGLGVAERPQKLRRLTQSLPAVDKILLNEIATVLTEPEDPSCYSSTPESSYEPITEESPLDFLE